MEHGTYDLGKNFELIVRAVITHKGNILLCRMKGNANYFLPGGHIEFGEAAPDALRREIKEELGVSAKPGKFIGASENMYTRGGKKIHEVNLVFEAVLSKTNVRSIEERFEFFWKDIKTLGKENVLPVTLKRSVMHWLGDKKMFFAG